MFSALFNRRLFLNFLAATAALPFSVGYRSAKAQQANSGARAIILSDIHSAYERMGQLLASVEAEVASADNPAIILVNGDIFELGNAVASRSGGEIDWIFLEALAKLAPTIINIGNHEPDFDNDLANFVTRARGIGATVLSNIVDTRTGAPYTEASTTLTLSGLQVTVTGLATDSTHTYPKDTREMLDIPEPVEWSKTNLPGLLAGNGIRIVLSHAGVVPDRAILPLLPDGTLLVGGHDHLNFTHEEGATRYVHTGSWANAFSVATFDGKGLPIALRHIDVDRNAPSSPALQEIIPAVLDRHLSDEERAIIGHLDQALTIGQTGRFVADLMAQKAGADVGFIGHTSFGAGLPAGDISRFDFNASLRFDGKLMLAEVSADVLQSILAVCNQDGDVALSRRTGDFLYAEPLDLPAGENYRIVCNDWSALNQKSYFGRDDLDFAEVPDMLLKQTVIEALSKG